MFESLFSSVGDKWDAFTTKAKIYIVIGIIVIVIVSLLLDKIRTTIRGLDIAALGALLLWLGYKTSKIVIIKIVSKLLLLIGGTLFVVGLIVFILIRLYRSKRKKRAVEKAQQKALPTE